MEGRAHCGRHGPPRATRPPRQPRPGALECPAFPLAAPSGKEPATPPARSQIAALLAALAAAAPGLSHAAPARGAFVMTMRGDTLATERYERDGERATGTLVFRLVGLRFDYALAFAPDGTVSRMENAVRPASADPASTPTQSATLDWVADSVVAEVKPGTAQRFASRRGAMPYLNPSMFLLEAIVQRALAASPPLENVPVFAVSGGQTFAARVRRLGGDSASVAMGGAEFVLRLAADGSLVSGGVPAQGVRFARADSLPGGALTGAPVDYSAPAGAPWHAEEVRVPTRGGFALAGTLALPERKAKHPCVLLVTGSGPQDRDESIPLIKGFRPFRQVADTLARRGIAVLRLDDRGTGGSGGRFAGSTSADFADDVEDALRWLATRPDVDTTRLALLGHSEGGLIAPLVASRGARLRAMVLLAAPAWTGRRVIEYQNERAVSHAYTGAAFDSVMRAAMHGVDSIATVDPWVGFFTRHDPLAVARRLADPPVLVLQGATDRQVAAGQAGELARAFRGAGNRDVTLRVLPATNHLFLPDSSGDPAGYARLTVNAIPRETLGLIADWLAARLLPAAKPRPRD